MHTSTETQSGNAYFCLYSALGGRAVRALYLPFRLTPFFFLLVEAFCTHESGRVLLRAAIFQVQYL